ncbi:MAG: hypothetical protein Q9208_004782 [Pyrenodesmia sp. 3 TL-2023]
MDASKFRADAASEEIMKFNEFIMDSMEKGPRWFQVGAAKYREMWAKGETVFPPAVVLDRGKSFSIPSRDKGMEIPCRALVPENGRDAKAVYMHIHGGGWVLSSEKDNDTLLAQMADIANVVVVSVGYRLAPEDPFPRGPEDCYDAAEWLIGNATDRFGVELQFIGGESAGAHLTMLTYLHLAKIRPDFHLSGLIFNYSPFDLSFLPQVHNFQTRGTLILDKELIEHFAEAFCPGMSLEQRRDPSVSPFYRDLRGLELPPAMFICGTEDCLLDDTVMMSAKWQMNGGTAVVRIFPGAPHGFTVLPQDQCAEAKEGVEANAEMNTAVAGIQGITGYTFSDGSLVWEAVSAAGSIISGGGRRFADGNKRLAILGDTVLQLALAEDWYDGTEPRAAFNRIRQEVSSNNNLNMIGLANNIDPFINLAGAQTTVSPATRAATVEAVIGAVYLDSSDMHMVKGAMRTLGLI